MKKIALVLACLSIPMFAVAAEAPKTKIDQDTLQKAAGYSKTISDVDALEKVAGPAKRVGIVYEVNDKGATASFVITATDPEFAEIQKAVSSVMARRKAVAQAGLEQLGVDVTPVAKAPDKPVEKK